ncbi:MAG: hypothetical protein GXP16_14145 [Gammaproteobacteria bacterium]|nr:hypothetical protein [Gammaproteobacteria bacterium]
MRRFWLVRHGKASNGELGRADHERRLSARGERDASAVQAWCEHQNKQLSWVWCSTACRAVDTATPIARGSDAQLVQLPELYLASPEVILATLQSTPTEVFNAAIVAHNPGLSMAANMMSNTLVTSNLVTLAIAIFEFDADWCDLQFGRAQFQQLLTPKSGHFRI